MANAAPTPSAASVVVAKPAIKTARKQRAKAAAPIAPTRAASVYLMRGFLGIFSLGMDQIDASLTAKGVKTRLLGHTSWPRLVEEVSAEAALHPARHVPVVFIGHSLGANAVLQAAAVLGKRGIPVDLVVTVDGTQSQPISPVVKRYLNIYMSGDAFGAKLAADGKGVDNVDIRNDPALNRSGVNHFTIDKNPLVQQQVIAETLKALGRTGKGG